MKIACVAVIRNLNDEILLLKRNRSPFGYGLPGGKLEEGETILNCVIREVREETGIGIISATLRKTSQSAEGLYQVIIYECIPVSTDVTLSSEHDEFIWISEDKLPTLDLAGNTSIFLKF